MILRISEVVADDKNKKLILHESKGLKSFASGCLGNNFCYRWSTVFVWRESLENFADAEPFSMQDQV